MKHLILLCVTMVMSLFSTYVPEYDTEWIVGKTESEIVARYGEFDDCYSKYSPDGVDRGWAAEYTLKEERHRFFGTLPEEYIKISFDANNVATRCEECVGRIGG